MHIHIERTVNVSKQQTRFWKFSFLILLDKVDLLFNCFFLLHKSEARKQKKTIPQNKMDSKWEFFINSGEWIHLYFTTLSYPSVQALGLMWASRVILFQAKTYARKSFLCYFEKGCRWRYNVNWYNHVKWNRMGIMTVSLFWTYLW